MHSNWLRANYMLLGSCRRVGKSFACLSTGNNFLNTLKEQLSQKSQESFSLTCHQWKRLSAERQI
ncbi:MULTISPECIES: hypothetical protein [Moorena]|uniref:hypothetical protein n=1 Tax=Moorena TaxID=1155738 RepID=UPI0011EA681B|nr:MULTISPECIES: hypothetical protein [Moorena]NEO08822.1 hypothetical protein [Moorena sp. SIO3I8]